MQNARDWLDLLSQVLLRCAVLGILLILIWFGVFWCSGDVLYNVHGKLFGMTRHELNLIHYGGMALTKLCVLLFFLFPYIAIRLVLRRHALQ